MLKHIGSKKVLGQTVARTSRPTVAPFPKRDPGRAQRAGLRRPRSQTCGVIFRMCIFPGMIVGRRVADTSIFAAAFRALRGPGYDCWLTIEAFGRALPRWPRRREFGAISSRRRRRSIARVTSSFAVAGTKPESSVAVAAGRAAISIRHRGTVPNVAPRNS